MDKIKYKTEGQATYEYRTGYKNSWTIAAGMEYKFSDDLDVRGGLVFVQGATKRKWLRPETNDISEIDPTFGIAYDVTESMELNISGVYIFGLEKEYNDNTYDFDNIIVNIGLRFMF